MTTEQRSAADFELVLKELRRFIREQVVPREEEIEETNSVPDKLREHAAEMGLYGFSVPPEYGGLGLTMVEEVKLAMEIGYTSPAFRSIFGTNAGIAGQMLVRFGSEEQREKLLPEIASGRTVAAFALTEPEAGSDPSSLQTSAKRTDSGYVVNGAKCYITNAPLADLFVVFARTTPGRGSKGISAFLIDATTPGITVGPPDKKMGQSGALSSDVFFDDVEIPLDSLIGEEGQGFRSAMRILSRGRLHIGAVCVGLADRLIEESVTYARERKQFGREIGEFQLVQGMLADSQTECYAARCMVLETARRYDAGDDDRMANASCKYYASEMVSRVADRAVQIYGGMGYMRGVAVERLYRDARLFRIYEGTSQIQQVIIARALLNRGK
jgi:acyl-CoA dehydrogenase